MPKTHKKKGGGMFDFFSSAWDTTKRDAANSYNSLTQTVCLNKPTTYGTTQPTTYGSTQPSPSYGSTSSSYAMGGKRRRKSRRMRGGNFTDNTPRTGVASTASPITGIKSAQPHNLVGGRTRRRCRKSSHSKSCRHRKH